MTAITDCLLIGHNEMNFNEYAESVYALGKDSSAYRDLQLNFIWSHGKRQTITDIFNQYAREDMRFRMGDTLSTTISYLGTYLNKYGFSFDFINDFQQEKEDLKDKLLSGNILTIGVTTTLYTHAAPIVEICNFIRKYNTKAKIIIGGPYVFNLYFASQDERSLNNFLKTLRVDFLVNSSQGEATLVNLLKALKTNGSFCDIPSLTFWRDNAPITNLPEPENNKLDENVINWGLFSNRLGNFAGVRTCISCSFTCRFCGFNQRAGKHQTASLEAIEKELDILESAGTIKSVNFIDDTFNFPPQRFKEILKMMIRKKYTFKWNSYFRCQFADEETVKLMEESGCEGVYLGIESANQKILDNMRKHTTVGEYRRGVNLLKNSSIMLHMNFIVGFVGETKETIKDTTFFIKEFQPDFYRAQLWYLDRLTPIWKERDKFNIKGSHFMWSHETMDSSKACDLTDQIVMDDAISSAWLPVYNFNFHNLFRLKHKGVEFDTIKKVLKGFTNGIREGISNADKTDVSENVILEIKEALMEDYRDT